MSLVDKTFEHEIRKTEVVRHLHLLASLLSVAAAAAGNAGLGHVALEDALLDVGGVVLLAFLSVETTEEDTLGPLVELSAQEEQKSSDKDNAPFPVKCVSEFCCIMVALF